MTIATRNPLNARRSALSRASLALAITAALSVASPVMAGDVCDTTAAGESGSGSTAPDAAAFACGASNGAYDIFSSAVGILNEAWGPGSTAFGLLNNAYGEDSSAFGILNETGAFANAFGRSNVASGSYSSLWWGQLGSGSLPHRIRQLWPSIG